jgi:hypothetical protein
MVLNLASNIIGNQGMTNIFTHLKDNISLTSLNVSTCEGKNRNRIQKSGINAMATFFNQHQAMTVANLSGIGLKDKGLEALLQVLGSVAANVNEELKHKLELRDNNIKELAEIANITKDDKVKRLIGTK